MRRTLLTSSMTALVMLLSVAITLAQGVCGEFVNRALDALLIRYTNQISDDTPPLPLVEFDSDWPSECVIESGNAPGHYYWKPVVRTKPISFSNLEKAVEFQFRSELSEFYGSFWSNGICVERQDINLLIPTSFLLFRGFTFTTFFVLTAFLFVDNRFCIWV